MAPSSPEIGEAKGEQSKEKKERTIRIRLTVGPALEDVALHLEVTVLGSEVDVGRQHHLDVHLLLG